MYFDLSHLVIHGRDGVHQKADDPEQTSHYLSFTRLAEANQINGGVLDAATYLQKRIDETAIDLRSCS